MKRYEHWLPKQRLCERLVQIRKERGWTLKELADRSGVNYSVLSYAQIGSHGLTAGNLSRIARACDLFVSELLEGVDLSEWE